MSPIKMPPIRRPSRTISFLYVPRLASENWITSSRSSCGSVMPMLANSTPITFSLVASFEPWYAASRSVCVTWSANTFA